MKILQGSLHADWAWIKDKIEAIRVKAQAEWLPEDIYCRIKNSEASLYVNEKRNSFAIIAAIQNQHTGECGIEIMFAYAANGENTESIFASIEALAKENGYTFLEMKSIRNGFSRKGWKIKNILYKRKI